jgi:uncharacterized protein (DUF1778 family)
LIARVTWSWTKPLKQPLQKAALWRGSLMTAFVLHLVQFIAEEAISSQQSAFSSGKIVLKAYS